MTSIDVGVPVCEARMGVAPDTVSPLTCAGSFGFVSFEGDSGKKFNKLILVSIRDSFLSKADRIGVMSLILPMMAKKAAKSGNKSK